MMRGPTQAKRMRRMRETRGKQIRSAIITAVRATECSMPNEGLRNEILRVWGAWAYGFEVLEEK